MLKPNNPCEESEKEFDDDDLVLLLDRVVKGQVINKVQEETRQEERSELDLFVDLHLEDGRTLDAHALIDSGCTGSFIDVGFVECY